MAANNLDDQDAIAAQWEASLDSEDPAEAAAAAAANELSGTMALQWAAMVEDGSRDFGGGKNGGERVLFDLVFVLCHDVLSRQMCNPTRERHCTTISLNSTALTCCGAIVVLTRRVSSSRRRNRPAEPLRSIGRSSRI